MKTALLRTACGCEQIVAIKEPHSYYEVALMRPMYLYEKFDEKVTFQIRRFKLFCQLGPESWEYREELE